MHADADRVVMEFVAGTRIIEYITEESDTTKCVVSIACGECLPCRNRRAQVGSAAVRCGQRVDDELAQFLYQIVGGGVLDMTHNRNDPLQRRVGRAAAKGPLRSELPHATWSRPNFRRIFNFFPFLRPAAGRRLADLHRKKELQVGVGSPTCGYRVEKAQKK